MRVGWGRGFCGVVALLAGCTADTASIIPLKWQKVLDSPTGQNGSILGPDGPGTFDEVGNFTVSAFEDGGVTYLYYGGADASGSCPGLGNAHFRIGLATSTDGVSFGRVAGTAFGGAVLDDGSPGTFDSYLTDGPYVLKDGAVYRMWYSGSDQPYQNCAAAAGQNPLADDRRIGYAESTDGVHWTKFYDGDGPGGSVLPLGAAGDIDAQQVAYARVIKDGDGYKMYYSANDVTDTWRVALAVSTDARHWTKVRGKIADGAVLDVGNPGAFDAACAYQPTVVKEQSDLYRMWYRACPSADPTVGGPSQGFIGYAESNDGVTWIKVNAGGAESEALDPGPPGEFDSGGLTSPSVFLDGATWTLYYAGFDASGRYRAGLARAPGP